MDSFNFVVYTGAFCSTENLFLPPNALVVWYGYFCGSFGFTCGVGLSASCTFFYMRLLPLGDRGASGLSSALLTLSTSTMLFIDADVLWVGGLLYTRFALTLTIYC